MYRLRQALNGVKLLAAALATLSGSLSAGSVHNRCATAAICAADRVAERFPAPGMAVAEVSRETHYLFLGVEEAGGHLVRANTVFQIASLTKPFTAMVIMKLIEQRRLSLDDRASKWLKWLPKRYDAVTVRQLLTHTSGVPRDLRRANVDEFSLDEFRTRFVVAEPSFAPGTRWEYANTGYILLAMIAESAGGRSLGAQFQSDIFQPAGMRHTRFRAPLTRARGRAVGHDWTGKHWQAAPPVHAGYGNSGIETTVSDMARFARALQRRALLRPESYAAMLTPQKLASGEVIEFPFRNEPTKFGLGWFLNDICGIHVASHGGTIAGFSSNLSWVIDRREAIAVLSNGKAGPDRIGLADKVAVAAIRAGLGCSRTEDDLPVPQATRA